MTTETITVADYETNETLRVATRDDLERAIHADLHTGVYEDADGRSVYLEGVALTDDGHLPSGVECAYGPELGQAIARHL